MLAYLTPKSCMSRAKPSFLSRSARAYRTVHCRQRRQEQLSRYHACHRALQGRHQRPTKQCDWWLLRLYVEVATGKVVIVNSPGSCLSIMLKRPRCWAADFHRWVRRNWYGWTLYSAMVWIEGVVSNCVPIAVRSSDQLNAYLGLHDRILWLW